MSKKRLLVQWVDVNDVRAMADSQPPAERDEIIKKVGRPGPRADDIGPTKSLLNTQQFDEIRLLSIFDPDLTNRLASWLGRRIECRLVNLADVNSYEEILQIAEHQLAEIRMREDWSNTELCLHLTPGTSAMAAIWLLLGSTRFAAVFYDTRDGTSRVFRMPFNTELDAQSVPMNSGSHGRRPASPGANELASFQDIVGESQAIRNAVSLARRVAGRSEPVLLLGESGTGKKMLAQAIHRASVRCDGPFVAFNCAVSSGPFFESKLFGHRKGAFTGADTNQMGVFEMADGGTLFLDKVGECNIDAQATLFRVLQPTACESTCVHSVRRVGEDCVRKVDVRIIAATSCELHSGIRAGTFLADLFYLLATISISLPPLRERRTDIASIAKRLLERINLQCTVQEPCHQYKTLSPSAVEFIERHDWPGNVQQLFNVLFQAALLSDVETLGLDDLATALSDPNRNDANCQWPASTPPTESSVQLRYFGSSHPPAGDDQDMTPAHGIDFRSVNWFGTVYTFTTAQAACIKVLWEHLKRRTPTVGNDAILEAAELSSGRLRDIFESGRHPAWGTLIVPSGKGGFRLNEPEKTPPPQ